MQPVPDAFVVDTASLLYGEIVQVVGGEIEFPCFSFHSAAGGANPDACQQRCIAQWLHFGKSRRGQVVIPTCLGQPQVGLAIAGKRSLCFRYTKKMEVQK